MTTNPPLVQQNSSYPAAHLRGFVQAFTATGPVDPGDLKVTQRGAGPNMSVDVAPGYVVVPSAEDSRDWYLARVTATEHITLAAAPGIGSSRIDLIVATITDVENGDGADALVIEALTGDASSSPLPPAQPPGSVALAEITVGPIVAAIVNANIADKRNSARPIAYTAQRPSDSYNGAVAITPGGGRLSYFSGQWIDVALAKQFKAAATTITRDVPVNGALTAFGATTTATVLAGPVNVLAHFTGDAYYTGGSQARVTVAVEISLDGGSTWQRSAECSGTTSNLAPSTEPDMAIAASHARSGTSTGSIKVRIVANRDGAVDVHLAGQVSVMVTPG